jgi:hypothetical protein
MRERSEVMNPEMTPNVNDASSTLSARPAKVWDGPTVIRDTTLTFDPGDKFNGSLYLCDPSGASQSQALDQAIALLRGAGLWSSQLPKQVRDDQKAAYETQLQFVEAVDITVAGAQIVIARYDHPKFPSSADRFDAWKKALGIGT